MIINPANDGWVEVAIHRRADAPPVETDFLKSLQFSSGSGLEIGEGASSTVGDSPAAEFKADSPVDPKPSSVADASEGSNEPLTVISTPRAIYTSAAREAKTQGSVLVRVTLLANGSVGAVEVVRGLDNGLTEQAVGAARKIAFLPKRVNSVPVTVVKTMEYSFSIY